MERCSLERRGPWEAGEGEQHNSFHFLEETSSSDEGEDVAVGLPSCERGQKGRKRWPDFFIILLSAQIPL